jgi:hypothetical protein
LRGIIEIGGHEWEVWEEKRAGPQSQLFSLTAVDTPRSRMHVRSFPGQPAGSLEEVKLLAMDPQIRWFADPNGVGWEARIVLRAEPKAPDTRLVKFISEKHEVREGAYPFLDGLGGRTDDELGRLLAAAN